MLPVPTWRCAKAETNKDVRDFYTMQRIFQRHRGLAPGLSCVFLNVNHGIFYGLYNYIQWCLFVVKVRLDLSTFTGAPRICAHSLEPGSSFVRRDGQEPQDCRAGDRQRHAQRAMSQGPAPAVGLARCPVGDPPTFRRGHPLIQTLLAWTA